MKRNRQKTNFGVSFSHWLTSEERGNHSFQPWPTHIQKVVHALLSTFIKDIQGTKRHTIEKKEHPHSEKGTKMFISSNKPAAQAGTSVTEKGGLGRSTSKSLIGCAGVKFTVTGADATYVTAGVGAKYSITGASVAESLSGVQRVPLFVVATVHLGSPSHPPQLVPGSEEQSLRH